jgi:hypothetical protein
MTGEKKMFMSCDMIDNHIEKMPLEAIVVEQLLVLVKLLSQSIIQFSMFIWLNLWTIICYPFSQLCEMGYNYLFTNEGVTIFRRGDDSTAFKGEPKGKLYLVDFISDKAQLDTCLLAKSSLSWLQHHRLAHVRMNNLNKLIKGNTS